MAASRQTTHRMGETRAIVATASPTERAAGVVGRKPLSSARSAQTRTAEPATKTPIIATARRCGSSKREGTLPATSQVDHRCNAPDPKLADVSPLWLRGRQGLCEHVEEGTESRYESGEAERARSTARRVPPGDRGDSCATHNRRLATTPPEGLKGRWPLSNRQ